MKEGHEGDLVDGVAIIGMVGRFPGARDVQTLWRNLCESKESITFFSDDELHSSIDTKLRNNPNYIKAKGVLDDVEQFDPLFFGINPAEAVVMDPQHRLFLEASWEVLESAGYDAGRFDGLIGVFAGMNNTSYFASNLSGNRDVVERVGEVLTMFANEKDYLSTRVSYKLNLKGPSVNVFSACSTSLVAVCQAVQGLITYQCDMALAGGVSITVPQQSGYLYQEGGMLSPDGHCRPFDASAQGTTFNNGLGIVLLKRYEDAVRDRDSIYAVIRGVGVNNDGSDKVSFTAPSVEGQAEAILMAHEQAGIEPDTISYVETHGTGTPLGDPIEIEALNKAFRTMTNAKQFCAIGSIKSNVGHLVHAAGVAGLIKTALAIKNNVIPPTLFFERANPNINFEDTPFYVNNRLMEWGVDDAPRRAGVSSFGVGGTNAHVVVEEAPPRPPSGPSRPRKLVVISAKTESALHKATQQLAEHLTANLDAGLADIAYTLQQGRQAFNWRRIAVCDSTNDAADVLASLDARRVFTRQTERRGSPVVFMFPGQGAQYVHMGANLYSHEPVFRNTVDKCAEILKPFINADIRDIIYPDNGDLEVLEQTLKRTDYTQPALFTVEYALSKLWIEWGVQPDAMIGHSIGEYVAACLAGVFSVEDALRLVAIRGQMMYELPSGSMLSVRLPANELESRLDSRLSIAAINGPNLTVISGTTEAVSNFKILLDKEETPCRLLHTSHAFHSPMMDKIIETFEREVEKVARSAPQIPIVSTVTADWLSEEQAKDPHYWSMQLRKAVRFSESLCKVWEEPDRVMLEVGPRTTTTTMARQQIKDIASQVVVPSLGDSAEDDTEWTALLSAVGKLWLTGVEIDWTTFASHEIRNRVKLPTYPFERKRYWVEPPQPASVTILNDRISHHQTQEGGDLKMQQPRQDENGRLSEANSEPKVASRHDKLVSMLRKILEETSGMELGGVAESMSFLEMGLDSLFLTQASMELQKRFEVPITFRQMLEDYSNMAALADYLDQELPPEAFNAPPAPQVVEEKVTNNGVELSQSVLDPINQPQGTVQGADLLTGHAGIEKVISDQMRLMSEQLEMLRSFRLSPDISNPAATREQSSGERVSGDERMPPVDNPAGSSASITPSKSKAKSSRNFGPGVSINKSKTNDLNKKQKAFLDALIARYTKKTARSKEFTQRHRARLADPRTVSGFNPLWKEMVYPIVTNRSLGSKLWDLDGNEYIDLTNGFGPILLGYSPDFVMEAVRKQLEKGIETGPQTPLAGEVADLFCEMTGNERMAFCNTGSEAVLAAMRLARTVTGRSRIATFTGDYHGIFDEVIVRGSPSGRALSGAPGIMPEAVENMLVLEYGDPDSIEVLRSNAKDLAAVMVEPVQSRNPDLQPKEFLQELRRFTEESGSALIFDEVVTGFRAHLGGAQAHFNIRADLATYGKVVAGGYPIGIVAGNSRFMDALDGGYWQYGDQSFPQVGVTFFAGTFVRHPLTLAATKAVLEFLKAQGPQLQMGLNDKMQAIVQELRAFVKQRRAPINLGQFSSLIYPSIHPSIPYGGLLFHLMREKGIHVWEDRPWFLTIAHSEADIRFFIEAFKQSVVEMQDVGLLPIGDDWSQDTGSLVEDMISSSADYQTSAPVPPVPGAKLGRDLKGDPAWFVPDPDRPGKFLQVGSVS